MVDMIQERRWTRITIILLVILNLALIASMALHERSGPGLGGPPEAERGLEFFLENELGLAPDQVDKMHQIRRQHFENNEPLVRAVRDSSELLIQLAFDPDPDIERIDELTNHLAMLHAEMDRGLFHHFVQLNGICTPGQQLHLKDLARELTRGGAPPPPREPGLERRPPPRR